MSREAVRRRLAAILATDVVGYSRLMAADEEGTLARLRTLRAEFIDPTIARHHGRIVKLMGDGALVEFASVVDAVRCAVDIQRGMAECDSDIPQDQRIRLRIGINLGDVVIEGDDIYGDGVNVAARLEGLAEPGGIVISGTAFDHAKKAEAGFRYIGRQQVKNIPEPVRTYQVLLDPVAVGRVIDEVPAAASRLWPAMAAVVVLLVIGAGALAWLQPWEATEEVASEATLNTHRIAVLPFASISADGEDAYFADGMTEELISQLSKISEIRVIARSSVLKYKDAKSGIDEIGRELSVGTILEGSVRRVDDQVRITAQLIDVASQEHHWSNDYDRKLDAIFEVQADIAKEVADALRITLLPETAIAVETPGTENPEAYDLYLRGLYFYNRFTEEGSRKAQAYFEKVIDLDPSFAPAYAKLAETYARLQWHDDALSRDEALRRMREAAERAVDLDPTLPEAYSALASAKYSGDWDWSGAEADLLRAIELNPSYARAHRSLGSYIYSGALRRPEKAIAESRKAVDLDPWVAANQEQLGWAYYHAEQFEEALSQFRMAQEMFPDVIWNGVGVAQSLAMLGRFEEAVSAMKDTLALRPGHPFLLGFMAWTYGVAGQTEKAEGVIQEMVAANTDKSIPAMPFAWAYTGVGAVGSAIAWLQTAADRRDVGLEYMQAPEFRQVLAGEPDYEALRERLKLEGPET